MNIQFVIPILMTGSRMNKIILTLIFLCLFTQINSFAQTNYYYLAQWEWFTEGNMPYWRCPGGDCIGLVDLRSLPQMSKAGGIQEGYGFFVYPALKVIPGSIYLGTDSKLENKAQIKTVLGLLKIPTETTPVDLLWNLLVYEADPTGQTKWKPLRGSLEKETELCLANKIVKSEKVIKGSQIFCANSAVNINKHNCLPVGRSSIL